MTKRTPAEKADNLIAFFKGREMPAGPFRLNCCTVVNDINVTINTLTLRLQNARPSTLMFNATYLALYELKKHIENDNN